MMVTARSKTPLNRVQLTSFLVPFQTKIVDHCVLYHHVTQQNSNTTVVGELPSSKGQTDIIPTGIMVIKSFGNDSDVYVQPSQPMSITVVLPDSEKADMQSFVRTHRHSLLVEDKQELMIGCAVLGQQFLKSAYSKCAVRCSTLIVLSIQIMKTDHFSQLLGATLMASCLQSCVLFFQMNGPGIVAFYFKQ